MFQPRSIQASLSFRDKLISIDYILAKPDPQHETKKHQEDCASEVLHYYYQYHTAGTQNFMTTTQNIEEPHL